jgi:hypothetical protein
MNMRHGQFFSMSISAQMRSMKAKLERDLGHNQKNLTDVGVYMQGTHGILNK